MRTLLDADLLVLDDLFLARRISDVGSELPQSLVHQRYKLKRRIVVTSNRVVQDCGKYLADNTMATTILDRLMHRTRLLEFEGKSYRLNEAAGRLTGLVKLGGQRATKRPAACCVMAQASVLDRW